MTEIGRIEELALLLGAGARDYADRRPPPVCCQVIRRLDSGVFLTPRIDIPQRNQVSQKKSPG
jgi:hypothetical protein